MGKNFLYLLVVVGFIGILFVGSERVSDFAFMSAVNYVGKEARDEVENLLSEAESLTNTKDLNFYFPSFSSDKFFFDNAYFQLLKPKKFDEKLKSAIVPHHLIFPKKIASFFDRLSVTQNIDTVFLIGPNHSNTGSDYIHISKYGYSTPYGNIEIDSKKVDKILDSKNIPIAFEKEVFDGEHSISSLTPFIKKSLPKAKIVPITLKWHTPNSQIDQLLKILNDTVGPNDIVIGSIDFSHYLPFNVANFHDKTALMAIKNWDFKSFEKLEIDSLPTLKLVTQFAYTNNAKNIEIIDHSNSANFSPEMLNVPETTSHFYIAFKNGNSSPQNRGFSMLAVGDIMLGRYVRIISERNGDIEYPFELIRGKENRFFNGFDILFGNLEGPIYKEGVRSETSMVFGFNEDVAPMLSRLRFDILSIANNHILNQGNVGFDSTVNKLTENGIGACGHPINIDENNVVFREIGGEKIAFICFEDSVVRLDKTKAVNLISNIKKKSDFVVVSPHFGVEYVHTANKRQIELAHDFIDAGADIIIGTHPHVVQNFEIYKDKPIFYSLGNFIFDQYWSADTQEGLGIGLVVEKESYKLYLFPILSKKSQPYLMSHEEQNSFFEKFIKWSDLDESINNMIRNGVIEIKR